jgi:amino acid adenylation domain-containing protein
MPYRNIHEMFSKTAESFKGHVAITWRDHIVTYDELESKSNSIANFLISSGLSKGEIVALLTEQPVQIIASILGILKAGGVFVPLDLRAPSGRLSAMVRDVAPGWALSEPKYFSLLGKLVEGSSGSVKVASLGHEQSLERIGRGLTYVEGLAAYSDPRKPAVQMSPEDMCYIYFTSGSTGKPKGIAGRLKGIDHFIRWEIKTLSVGEGTRVSQLTAPTFDAYLRDVFVPLCAGGTVCAPDDREKVSDPSKLVEWINHQRINIIHCVPSLFRAILQQELKPEYFASLKHILMAGEPLLPADVKKWMSVFGERVQLVNLYGPSETTMVKLFHMVERADAERRSIPIGKPIEGAKALVVDEEGQACAPGKMGEIYIRTPYRTLGYFKAPDLTAQVFIPNPFNPKGDPDDIVYKTGDLGVMREDGVFEFLGRKDHQIKLYGVRVELSEIECVLRDCEYVRDAVVVAHEDAKGAKYLCAYIVLGEGMTCEPLRKLLAERLPEYMIPRFFINLDKLPLTSNGKIDRGALPAPQTDEKWRRDNYVAPRTPVEMELARIWSRVFGIESIGLRDNFFALGGHSLIAPQIVSHIRSALAVNIPLVSLFDNPTVEGLATVIEEFKGEPQINLSLPQIAPDVENRTKPFPLTDVQQAYWVGRSGAFELGNVATHTYLELESARMSVERFKVAWQRLVDRHDMLRAFVLPNGQQQILQDIPPLDIEVLDLRDRNDDEVQAELESIRQRMSHEVLPSDQWPLFRLRVTLFGESRARFHMSYDLLISDAHSNLILTREFLHFYERPDEPLPKLELSFRDYVLGDLAMRETELYKRSWNYWENRLDALPPAPDLPLAKEPGQLDQPRFAHRIAQFDRECWSRVKQRAAAAGVTPSAVVLAVFAEVLGAWSKSQRFCINLTLYNRLPMHSQVNDIVGDFTSVTILEVDRTKAENFESRARRLQAQFWNDLEHRYVSGVEVIRRLQSKNSGSRKALYPVVFTSTLIHDVNRKVTPSFDHLAEQVYRSSQTSQVWLDNVVREDDGALSVRWNAVEDLFQEGMLEDMFTSFCNLMNGLGNDERTWKESALSLVPRAHLELQAQINRTDAPVPDDLLHEMFERQAVERPQQLALISTNRTLSYEELQDFTSQLGHKLRRMGARPNELVPVVMEKGWEQVVAVLAILKAGAAYLPIDAALPKERLWYLLENSEASIVMTQSHLNARLAWPDGLTPLCVDAEERTGRSSPIASVQEPDDLAYVIYTSGSTGLPKGAMLTHRNVVNRIVDVAQRFRVAHADRALALTALHHDLSVYDIFGLLAAGGTLVMPDAAATRDPGHWSDLMRRHGVTLWNSVPAFMEMLVEHAQTATAPAEVLPPSLRIVMMSGDKIPVNLPGRITALKPDVQVVSLGGPTETTIWDICYPIQSVDPSWKSIPYGKPMVNQRYYVLDEALQPRPTWVPGELYAAGVGLAKGYWRNEEQTRLRFITHAETGERLYRTGDLGRYLPDGNIEFLGRADFQVKIQGWRIELGEIEATLSQHPALRANVVTALDESLGKRLVAYVVPKHIEEHDERSSEGYAPDAGALDPVERLRFKLSKPGIRREPEKPSIPLIKSTHSEEELRDYVTRRSYRNFQRRPIPLERFSRLLSVLQPVALDGVPLPKYRYASAGGLYPVQIYLYVKPGAIEGVDAGTYYYNPVEHRLVALHPEARLTRADYNPANRANFDGAAFSIFFLGQFEAIRPIYGASSRDFCMIEAGLMTGLLERTAPDQQIGLCHIGGLPFNAIAHWFQLQSSHEFLYSLVGGPIDQNQVGLSALAEESSDVKTAVELLNRQPPANGHFEAEKGSTSETTPAKAGQDDEQLVSELRAFLASKLPQYMAPSAFVVLDKLPLSANGKVDRKQLPKPEAALEAAQSEYVAPKTEVEELVAAIWRDVLKVERAGIYDNFFDIGGNSLKLIQVHVKLRETLAADLPIVEMFQRPTIRSLAELLSRKGPERDALEEIDNRVVRQQEALLRARRPRREDD